MRLNRLILAFAITPAAFAASGEIMHCFAFTALESATPADWTAWESATAKLPKQIKGLKSVWFGKLAKPFSQIGPEKRFEPETTRKFQADEVFTLSVKRVTRQHGACFEFKDQAAFDAYGKHPAHDAWTKLYEKVRADGTATYQIVGR